jgi:hypothetical protein
MSDDYAPDYSKRKKAPVAEKKSTMFIPVSVIVNYLAKIIKENERFTIEGFEDVDRFYNLEAAFSRACILLGVRNSSSPIYSVPLNWRERITEGLSLKKISAEKNSQTERAKRLSKSK